MTSTQTTTGPEREDSMLVPGGGLGSHSNWLHGLDSPLVRDKVASAAGAGAGAAGQKELKLRFDVSQYSPEEIVVKTVDNKLLVSICAFVWFEINSRISMESICAVHNLLIRDC